MLPSHLSGGRCPFGSQLESRSFTWRCYSGKQESRQTDCARVGPRVPRLDGQRSAAAAHHVPAALPPGCSSRRPCPLVVVYIFVYSTPFLPPSAAHTSVSFRSTSEWKAASVSFHLSSEGIPCLLRQCASLLTTHSVSYAYTAFENWLAKNGSVKAREGITLESHLCYVHQCWVEHPCFLPLCYFEITDSVFFS